MNVPCFGETDTLHIELRPSEIAEMQDLDEYTPVEYDALGNPCTITVKHARERTALPVIGFEHVVS
jgi:uncharacterized protein YuzE